MYVCVYFVFAYIALPMSMILKASHGWGRDGLSGIVVAVTGTIASAYGSDISYPRITPCCSVTINDSTSKQNNTNIMSYLVQAVGPEEYVRQLIAWQCWRPLEVVLSTVAAKASWKWGARSRGRDSRGWAAIPWTLPIS